MPHVIVKLWPGKSEQQKTRLAEAIVKDVMNVLKYGEEFVSVAFEEIKPEDWAEKVYNPDIVTAGTGWVQQEGGEKQEIKPGDVIWTPPGVKHWHGATAIQEALDGKNVEWLEHVSDEQYSR